MFKQSKYLLIFALLIEAVVLKAQDNNSVLLPVLVNGSYGFARLDGKIVIKPKYDAAYPFYQNYELTTVFKKGKALVINRKGKVVKKGSSDFFHQKNFVNMNFYFPNELELSYTKRFCELDTCPKFEIIEAPEDRILFDKMNNYYFVSNQQKVYLMDENGKAVSDYYDRIKHYRYPEVEFCITEERQNGKFGLLDSLGNVLLTCVYDAVNYNGNGVFAIKQGSIQKDYKISIKDKDSVKTSKDVLRPYKVYRENKKSGVVDSLGNKVVENTYDKLYQVNDTVFAFWKADSVGLLTARSEFLYKTQISYSYDGSRMSRNPLPYFVMNDKFVFFNIDKKWLMVDVKGVQLGVVYDGLTVDYQDIARNVTGVSVGDKLGVIDKTGKLIVDVEYDMIYCLREDDSFLLKKDGVWTWISHDGKLLYSNIESFGYFIKGHIYIKQNDEWFYVSNIGQVYKQ